jgi:hypothetical protein
LRSAGKAFPARTVCPDIVAKVVPVVAIVCGIAVQAHRYSYLCSYFLFLAAVCLDRGLFARRRVDCPSLAFSATICILV